MAIRTSSRSHASPLGAFVPTPRVSHRRLPADGLGEAVLLWACGDCGELGDVAAVPAVCPACLADGTAIEFVVED